MRHQSYVPAARCFTMLTVALLPLAPGASHAQPGIEVRGQHFVDSQGRQVILRGLNVINKSKKEQYRLWHQPEDFAAMHSWGMNCIRLGILWDGIEPEPGAYDETYIEYIRSVIRMARAHDIFIVLDMHQDLFSVLYSDGAPEWATLHEDLPHVKGEVWSDAYMLSPAVQAAFDNFWADAPGPGGTGIQTRYAAMWAHVVKALGREPNVIGYDLMNEPFPGSAVSQMLPNLAASGALDALANCLDSPSGVVHLMTLWNTIEGRARILDCFADVDLYQQFLEEILKPISQPFERERLQPMYQRVRDAIREHDGTGIIFMCPAYQTNGGAPSALKPLTAADGTRDPQQAYAPHGYDLVVDSPNLAQSNAARVAFIFEQHAKTADALGMPMLVGEWGAFYTAGPEVKPAVRQVTQALERHQASDTYWEYFRELPDAAYLPLLVRPAPLRISGKLTRWTTDPAEETFTIEWEEDPAVTAESIIYVPAPYEDALILEPEGAGFRRANVSQDTGRTRIAIPPTGQQGIRVLRGGK